tara:strand:+ start:3654 stop:4562 length:909 start_codon:yes stop_codon:yes gene_type:complete
MSFLKKINLPEKTLIAKGFIDAYLRTKLSLYLFIASLIFSMALIQTSVPSFYVGATLRENETVSVGSLQSASGGGALAILGGGDTGRNATFNEFRSNVYSYVVAKKMWDKGWSQKVFAGGNTDIDPSKITKGHGLSSKLKAFILGYELSEYFTARDLYQYINNVVQVTKEIKGTNIAVFMYTDDREFARELIDDIIRVTDQHAKDDEVARSKVTIEGTLKQIAVSRNSAITASLASTVNNEYYKIAATDNDLPYHIYFIDPAYASEVPVSPNPPAIILSNIIISIFISLLISFVRKNKEDLW